MTAKPGWSVVDLVPRPDADPSKLLSGYVSPAGDVTVLGLDMHGGMIETSCHDLVPYTIGGLPPNTLLHLVLWNGDGGGTNVDVGFLDSGATGTVSFSAPLDAVFALTSAALELAR
jgi:hypothetical protein